MFEGREWYGAKGASDEAIERLTAVAPVPLPESYLSLLKFSNGGEGPLPVEPCCLRLDSAEVVVQTELDGTFHEFFPGLFVIGGNGGGEVVAFDFRSGPPYRLVFFDMTNIDLPESVLPLADTFDEALHFIGREE